MKVKSGAVTESRICVSENPEGSNLEAEAVHRLVATQRIHEIRDWKEILQHSKAFPEPETSFKLGEWLNEVFGR